MQKNQQIVYSSRNIKKDENCKMNFLIVFAKEQKKKTSQPKMQEDFFCFCNRQNMNGRGQEQGTRWIKGNEGEKAKEQWEGK